MAQRKCWDSVPHWNNFTVPELGEILEHCVALERLGIAQDEKMMASIERDIALRDKKVKKRRESYRSENKEQVPPQDYLIVPNV
jgi:hypothetical protein